MKRSNLTVIVTVAIFSVTLLGLSVLANMREHVQDKSTAILSGLFQEETETDEYQIISDLEGLDINLPSGSILINEYDKDFITLIATVEDPSRNHSELVYEINNNNLSLTNDTGNGIPFLTKNDLGIDCEIYIPRGMLDNHKIKINTVDANITVSSFQLKELSIVSVSGNILLNRVDADYISLRTTSGNIESYQTKSIVFESKAVSGETSVHISSDDIVTESVSGPIALTFDDLFERLDVSSVSGNIILMIPENDGMDIQYYTQSGSFTSEFETEKRGDHYIYRNARIPIKIQTTSGSVQIEIY